MGFKCQQCGLCCADPSLIVTLTHRDLLRFEFFLPDIDLLQIVSFYQPSNDTKIIEKRLMSPAFLTTRGKAFLGLQQRNQKCIFLEKTTCQIYEFRPMVCRAFPYTFQIRGEDIFWGYAEKALEYCPSIQKRSKIDQTELIKLSSLILAESQEFRKLVEIWNYFATNQLIEPTPQQFLRFIMGKIQLTVESFKRPIF
ncbi:MAG: YkgJ family cysteine cluster protein [Candidatus Helarchaeota archaeon]